MSGYIKSIDSKHMVNIGTEGFYSSVVYPNAIKQEAANPAIYNSQYGTDFILNANISTVDFTTAHAYPDAWYALTKWRTNEQQ